MEEKVNDTETVDTSSTKKRREDKIRKRDPKSWDNISKSASSLSDSEKLDVIGKKYVELYDEFRKVSQNCQNLEKSCVLLQKEKEHIRSEQAKSILARSRLENLCRELQKQNKQIKDENIVKIKEEEERRKEVAAKFQKTLDEVTSMMNDNREKNYKLRDDNIDMSNKISELYEEFQKREEDVKRMSKQMDLEKQLAKSTITKLEFELKAEREWYSKKETLYQSKLEEGEIRNKQLLENIKSMEEHLQVYKGQYEDFETTLDKSNKIFDNCKSEMVKMSKQILLLEKEVNNWKSKWQVSATSLIELSTLKQNQDIQLAAADKKIEQLQKLCRQLQVDRGNYLKLLKTNGIEPVSQVCVENTEKPPTSKERELVILKDSLRMLQEQLKYSLNSAAETLEGNSNSDMIEKESQPGTAVSELNISENKPEDIKSEGIENMRTIQLEAVRVNGNAHKIQDNESENLNIDETIPKQENSVEGLINTENNIAENSEEKFITGCEGIEISPQNNCTSNGKSDVTVQDAPVIINKSSSITEEKPEVQLIETIDKSVKSLPTSVDIKEPTISDNPQLKDGPNICS